MTAARPDGDALALGDRLNEEVATLQRALSDYEQALREIAEWEGFTADCCDCMEDVVGIARAALSGSAGPREQGEDGGGRSASTSSTEQAGPA